MCVLAISIELRSTLRLIARMTPIRANIVGPPGIMAQTPPG
jgi:hypothetical protein